MDIHIRLGAPADALIIAEFNAAMAQETEALILDQDTLLKGVAAILSDPSKGLYYIAEVEGQIAGQLMITYEWSDWRNATFWWIQSVYVCPEFRQQGVFTALYRYIEQLAQSKSDICGLRLYVEQANVRAQKTYTALGMSSSHYLMMEVVSRL